MENQERIFEAAKNAAVRPHPPSDPLLESVAETIACRAMLPDGSTILVAVSGGADSVALLDALWQLAPPRKWNLHVAHVNHGLRGAESDADAAFVAQLAAQAGLPCAVRTVDVARAQQDHASPENTARRLRYRQLAASARAVGARFIALAHHQDDQAETVLLHLLRGSGLGGLAGMRHTSPLLLADETESAGDEPASAASGRPAAHAPAGRTLTLARPLLNVSRAEIRAYCARRNLPFREDSTNQDTAPQRNWLRHAVLPLLETRYPAAARTLARAAHVLAEDNAFLTAAAEDWLGRHARQSADGMRIDHAAWRALHPSPQAAVLRCAVARVAGHTHGLEHAHVAAARELLSSGRTGAASPLPGGLLCRVEHDGIWIGEPTAQAPLAPVALAIPGRTSIAPLACSIHAALVAPEDADVRTEPNAAHAWLDAARVGDALRVRARLPGDRFVPLGMNGAKKLQDFLVDARVPARLRDRVPLVVTAKDAIVWVAGHRIDSRYRVTAGTRHVLHLRLETPVEEDLP